ncbi:DUF2254 domain-containing protein [Piscinibacter koreensis]|uniref:DUF2254 domain-containing protein n=1 Tax=Piscinibacter koreensis TaxID=2742824 RepID=A0A7Y6TX76_9BURK|nr:DUF2254 domain-containing protein [Schlegelella koreensis]NUZ06785.1 DUF2254 domain-containing protein [Schlegelella koreensis]
MSTWLQKYWERLRASFWFLPSLMAVAAAALAFAGVTLDEAFTDRLLSGFGWLYTGGAEGASLVLSTVAGSMITIAGVVFSMTLVALSLASSQLGPRLLRNFMRDTANQVVIGTFVATFVYCLLVLRTIRRADEVAFVPHLSVTLGVVLALASLGVLIYFVHHVAMSIQVDVVVARVADELFAGVERLFPRQVGDRSETAAKTARDEARAAAAFEGAGADVIADGDGYLQLVDAERLMRLASEADVRIRLAVRPGHYVFRRQTLATVYPAERGKRALLGEIRRVFVLGEQRTTAQDIEFAMLQLVEVAVRALSPGINDPFTALTCVDRLGSALSRLGERDMPTPLRSDDQGVPRVLAPSPSLAALVGTALEPLRQHARADALVTRRLLSTIERLAPRFPVTGRAELLRQVAMIEHGVPATLQAMDRCIVAEACEKARRALRTSRVDDNAAQRSPATPEGR